jgi:hypothetical protein
VEHKTRLSITRGVLAWSLGFFCMVFRRARVDESEKDLNLIENEGHGKEEPRPQDVRVEMSKCTSIKRINKNFLFKIILQRKL